MDYVPAISVATLVTETALGERHAIRLFDCITSVGSVQYTFVVVVNEIDSPEPCLFVASEVNGLATEMGGASHFLGVFDEQGHTNLGASDDWADRETFYAEALRVAADRLGIRT